MKKIASLPYPWSLSIKQSDLIRIYREYLLYRKNKNHGLTSIVYFDFNNKPIQIKLVYGDCKNHFC